jgi:hypothetical protein
MQSRRHDGFVVGIDQPGRRRMLDRFCEIEVGIPQLEVVLVEGLRVRTTVSALDLLPEIHQPRAVDGPDLDRRTATHDRDPLPLEDAREQDPARLYAPGQGALANLHLAASEDVLQDQAAIVEDAHDGVEASGRADHLREEALLEGVEAGGVPVAVLECERRLRPGPQLGVFVARFLCPQAQVVPIRSPAECQPIHEGRPELRRQ